MIDIIDIMVLITNNLRKKPMVNDNLFLKINTFKFLCKCSEQ